MILYLLQPCSVMKVLIFVLDPLEGLQIKICLNSWTADNGILIQTGKLEETRIAAITQVGNIVKICVLAEKRKITLWWCCKSNHLRLWENIIGEWFRLYEQAKNHPSRKRRDRQSPGQNDKLKRDFPDCGVILIAARHWPVSEYSGITMQYDVDVEKCEEAASILYGL